MGVQIVHHQHYPVFVRVVHVHQLLDHLRRIDPGATIRDFHPAPPFQRRKQHEQAAHAVAPVFVIVGPGSPGPGRSWLAGLLHLLFAGLVQAYQNFPVPILGRVCKLWLGGKIYPISPFAHGHRPLFGAWQ